MTSLSLEPIYDAPLAAALAAALTIAVILLVTPTTPSPSQRKWLIALRLIAGGVLILALLRPALVRTDQRPDDAVLVVAVDTSESMTLPAGTGMDRWSVQTDVWRQLAGAILNTDDALDVQLLGYDRAVSKIPATASALGRIVPAGKSTDLAAPATAALQAAGGRPLAGLILLGDGAQTATQVNGGIGRVVESLESIGVPLWTVPIGPPAGDTALRDVAIDALPESYQLFAGNQAVIEFQVQTRGLVGVEIPIRLSWIDSADKQNEVAVRQVVPTQAIEVTPLSIPITVPDPGTYRLQVAASERDGELITANNTQTAFVEIRAGGGRVLVLAGSYRYEETFLRRSLRRFPDLDLTTRRITPESENRWPIDLGDVFQTGKFDVYVLGDLDARAIGDTQLEQLGEAIAAGTALVTLGGFQVYGAGGYANSPLAAVLPVEMNAARRQPPGAAVTAAREDQLSAPVEIRLVRRHPITDLGGADPSAIWQDLPPLPGATRLIGPRVAAGVEILLETAEGHPLLIIGPYGRGRTAALAFDSTWRWWRAGYDEAHRRFWRQLMLWLLSRQVSEEGRVLIEIDGQRFAGDNPPRFRASVAAAKDSPGEIDLLAEVIDSSDRVAEVESTRTTDGRGIRGRLPELPAGFHRFRVRPAEGATGIKADEKSFQVIEQSPELAQPMADPVYLRQLAAMTSEHGGKAFSPDEIDALIETIRRRRRSAEMPILQIHRLGDDPLSGWLLFGMFSAALTTEWWLRKRWGMA